MDPIEREKVAREMDGWIQGRYENLRAHETREVRQGKLDALTQHMKDGALSTATDILLSSRSEERGLATREMDAERIFRNATVGYTSAQIADLEDERKRGELPDELVAAYNLREKTRGEIMGARRLARDRIVQQLATETGLREQEWEEAVGNGLISRAEATARLRDSRRQTYALTMKSLVEDGNEESADALLQTLEDSGPDGRPGHLAKVIGFNPAEIAEMRRKIETARQARRMQTKRAMDEAIVAPLQTALNSGIAAGALGDLDRLEEAERELGRLVSGQADGSALRAKYAVHLRELGQTGDRIAQSKVVADVADALQNGTYADKAEPGGSMSFDPLDFGYSPDGRLAKALKTVGERFSADREKSEQKAASLFSRAASAAQSRLDRQAQRNAREATEIQIRAQMFAAVANGRPQEFYDDLASKVVSGELTFQKYLQFRNEYQNGWMRGFAERPGELPKQAALARDLFRAVEARFGEGCLAGTVALDGLGNPDLDARGDFVGDRKVDGKDLKYASAAPWSRYRLSFTPAEMRTILNQALAIARMDGKTIDFDPVTGQRLADGKRHTVNAVADFGTFLDALKDRKGVLDAADWMRRRGALLGAVRVSIENMERGRGEKMAAAALGRSPGTLPASEEEETPEDGE